MRDKHPGMQDGYLMSQAQAGELLGLNQRTVSKAESSLIKKIKAGIVKHGISEAEFFYYIKHMGT
jgi:DNA-binding CsgD family transcriptional regulator